MVAVITANIGRNIGADKVRADMQSIKRNGPLALVGFQEIDEADPANEHKILREVFGDSHELVNYASRVPVAVPKRWNVIRTETVRLSPGVSHVSPPRLATEVWVQTHAGVIVFMNFHLIAGAWNKKVESTQAIRREYWWRAVDKLKKRIKRHVRAGRTVIWMGDVNRMDMVKLHRKERRLVTQGIDSISAIEGKVKVTEVRTETINLHSDHNARVLRFKPKKKKRIKIPFLS